MGFFSSNIQKQSICYLIPIMFSESEMIYEVFSFQIKMNHSSKYLEYSKRNKMGLRLENFRATVLIFTYLCQCILQSITFPWQLMTT